MFAAIRRAHLGLGLVAGLGLLAAIVGRDVLTVPTFAAAGTDPGTPLWRVLALGVGVLPVLCLASPVRLVEEVATPVYRRAELMYFVTLVVASLALYGCMTAWTLPADALLVSLRAELAWLGLALVAGRLWGWRLAWILPVVGLLVVLAIGGEGEPFRQYYWWDVTARPAGDVPSALVCAALLTAGVVCWRWSPWLLRGRAGR